MASRLDCLMLPKYDLSGGEVIVTAGYGDGRGHRGVDLGSRDGIEVGTLVLAPVELQVVAYQYDGPFRPPNGHTAGHNLWLLGSKGQRFKAFHLFGPPIVELNKTVPAGFPIAKVGNSGTQAAHLHWEEHEGSWSNPINCEAAVRECLAAGRFAGSFTTPEDQEEDIMPDQADRIIAEMKDQFGAQLNHIHATSDMARDTILAKLDTDEREMVELVVRVRDELGAAQSAEFKTFIANEAERIIAAKGGA